MYKDAGVLTSREKEVLTLIAKGINRNDTVPFGGYKKSENGREWGEAGFEEYLETKVILGGA